MFSPLLNGVGKNMVYNSGNNPGLVLVLLNAPEKSRLFFILSRIVFDYIIPIVTEHRISFSTACLPVSKDCHIIAFLCLIYYWFNLRVQLSLSTLWT